MRNRTLRVSVEIALAVALAAVLNMPPLRLWTMPQGGEISLVMLPIFVIGLRHGLMPGLLAGLIASVPVYFTEPFVVHPVQFGLDYPVAFGLLGLSGLFAPVWANATAEDRLGRAVWTAILPAVVVGGAGRYIAHLVSGAVFFGEYAPEGQPVWVYSAVYNLVVPISMVACFVAAAIVLPVVTRVVPANRHAQEAR